MKAGPAILLAWLLAACSQDVRSLELADLDLSDMAVVQEMRRNLPPEDRAAFGTFVIQHLATSSSFCGEVLVDRNGKEPRTIGEAIALTALRAERERRERLAAERPPSAAEALRRKQEGLTSAREALIAQQDYLQAIHGPAAEQLPEWREISEQMTDYDAQLSELRPKLERAGG